VNCRTSLKEAVILSEGDVFSVDENWSRRISSPHAQAFFPLAATLADREREMIEAALAESRRRISGPSGAAAKLGIPRQTLDSKIANLQISKNQFKTQMAK
jgi:formate hydrogenlyase transcriptional activator